jgi:hypothetical protein
MVTIAALLYVKIRSNFNSSWVFPVIYIDYAYLLREKNRIKFFFSETWAEMKTRSVITDSWEPQVLIYFCFGNRIKSSIIRCGHNKINLLLQFYTEVLIYHYITKMWFIYLCVTCRDHYVSSTLLCHFY